jgi:hypothetical protein
VTKLLVAGSYPPVQSAAASATVAAVRRGWENGREVEVVSPRPSAAHRTARLVGCRGALELSRLRRDVGADEVVLSMEPGVPLSRRPGRWCHRVQAGLLRTALARFSFVTVLATSDLDVDAASMRPLWPAVDEVVVSSDDEGRLLLARLGVPAGLIRVDGRGHSPAPQVIRPLASVTPLGPPEWQWDERARHLIHLAGRKLLGRHASAVRARVLSVSRRARRVLHSIRAGS